jgi:DNA recombination protein RmuC
VTSTAVFVLSLAVLLFAGLAVFLFLQLQRRPGSSDGQALLQQQLESLRGQLAESLNSQSQSMNQQVHQMTTQVNQRLEDVSRRVADSQRAVGDRLDNAARVVGEVQKSLGVLGEASARIFDVGKDIAGLQEILRAPKMRGGLGEYFLADLLGQILPLKHFRLQHTFKTGATVDAVISLGGKLVPVDSKFPLENFRRVIEAKTDEERKPLRKKFMVDVKKHIDAIATKYILPDEDTYDFALMYIPAENVYYEVIVKDEDADGEKSLTEYALKQRVVPVSPNSFYAYLQAIILGLRGFEIEENARTIMQNLGRLQGDFTRFREDFEVLGKHLSNTRGKYEEAEKRLTRVQEKLSSVSSEGELPAPQTPAAELPLRSVATD